MTLSRSSAVLLIALRYLASRRLATTVSILAIALSLLLVVAMGLVNFAIKRAAVEGSIRYPLIVGPEGASSVQLIFSTIFHVDKPTGTIDHRVYEELSADDRIIAAYPLAVADALESYPIVGTTAAFLDNLAVGAESGSLALSSREDAVLGAEVASRTGLTVGEVFQGSHGMMGSEGAHVHDELSYRVSGVLRQTGGPEDAAVYTSYQTVWAMHGDAGHQERHEGEDHHDAHEGEDHHDAHEGEDHHDAHEGEDHQDAHEGEDHQDAHEESGRHEDHAKPDKYHLGVGRLTAVLVRTSNPVFTGNLERELTLRSGIQAIDTGRTIRRLVTYMNKGERLVEAFGAVTLSIAAALILVTLVMSLSERRKELALLRSLGVGRMTISTVIMVEALVITLAGAVLGDLGGHVAVWWAQGPLKGALGAEVEPWIITDLEVLAVGIALVTGQLLALVSLVWTYRMNLVEEVARD